MGEDEGLDRGVSEGGNGSQKKFKISYEFASAFSKEFCPESEEAIPESREDLVMQMAACLEDEEVGKCIDKIKRKACTEVFVVSGERLESRMKCLAAELSRGRSLPEPENVEIELEFLPEGYKPEPPPKPERKPGNSDAGIVLFNRAVARILLEHTSLEGEKFARAKSILTQRCRADEKAMGYVKEMLHKIGNTRYKVTDYESFEKRALELFTFEGKLTVDEVAKQIEEGAARIGVPAEKKNKDPKKTNFFTLVKSALQEKRGKDVDNDTIKYYAKRWREKPEFKEHIEVVMRGKRIYDYIPLEGHEEQLAGMVRQAAGKVVFTTDVPSLAQLVLAAVMDVEKPAKAPSTSKIKRRVQLVREDEELLAHLAPIGTDKIIYFAKSSEDAEPAKARIKELLDEMGCGEQAENAGKNKKWFSPEFEERRRLSLRAATQQALEEACPERPITRHVLAEQTRNFFMDKEIAGHLRPIEPKGGIKYVLIDKEHFEAAKERMKLLLGAASLTSLVSKELEKLCKKGERPAKYSIARLTVMVAGDEEAAKYLEITGTKSTRRRYTIIDKENISLVVERIGKVIESSQIKPRAPPSIREIVRAALIEVDKLESPPSTGRTVYYSKRCVEDAEVIKFFRIEGKTGRGQRYRAIDEVKALEAVKKFLEKRKQDDAKHGLPTLRELVRQRIKLAEGITAEPKTGRVMHIANEIRTDSEGAKHIETSGEGKSTRHLIIGEEHIEPLAQRIDELLAEKASPRHSASASVHDRIARVKKDLDAIILSRDKKVDVETARRMRFDAEDLIEWAEPQGKTEQRYTGFFKRIAAAMHGEEAPAKLDHIRKKLTDELVGLGYVERRGYKTVVTNPEEAEAAIRKRLEGMVIPDDYFHPVFQRVYSRVLGRKLGNSRLRPQFLECLKDEEVMKCIQKRGEGTGTSYPVHDVPRLEKRLTELAEDYKRRLGGRDKLRREYKPSYWGTIKEMVIEELGATKKEGEAWAMQYKDEFKQDATIANCLEKKGRNYHVKDPTLLRMRLKELIRQKQKQRKSRLDAIEKKRKEREERKRRNAERPTLARLAREEYNAFHGAKKSAGDLNYFCESLRGDTEIMMCIAEGEGTSRKYVVEEPEYVEQVRERIREILAMPPEERSKPEKTQSKSLSKLIQESITENEGKAPTAGRVQHTRNKIRDAEGLKGLLETRGRKKTFYFAVGNENICLARAEIGRLLYPQQEAVEEPKPRPKKKKAEKSRKGVEPVRDDDFLMIYFPHVFERRTTLKSKRQLASSIVGEMIQEGHFEEQAAPYNGTRRWHNPDDSQRRSIMKWYMDHFYPKKGEKPNSTPKPAPKKTPEPEPEYTPRRGELIVQGVRLPDFSAPRRKEEPKTDMQYAADAEERRRMAIVEEAKDFLRGEKTNKEDERLVSAIEKAKQYGVPEIVIEDTMKTFTLESIAGLYKGHPGQKEREKLDWIFKQSDPKNYLHITNNFKGHGLPSRPGFFVGNESVFEKAFKYLKDQIEKRRKRDSQTPEQRAQERKKRMGKGWG